MQTSEPMVGPTAHALDVIRRLIVERDLGPGDRLPTERELAAVTGVSRTTVRAALEDLDHQGRVVRQVGRGTYLTPDVRALPAGPVANCSPAEIMTARLTLEPQLMAIAVIAATGEDIADMRRWLAVGETARDSPSFEEADAALHHALAMATHNTMLVNFSKLLIDARHHPVWGGLKRRSFTPERHRCYCDEHADIVEAIAERDGGHAVDAMTAHLVHVRTNLLG